MRILWRVFYSGLVLPLLFVAVRLLALKNRKMRESLEGRRGLWQRMAGQLEKREAGKPMVWFHVASAGELLQAEPIMDCFLRGGYQCTLTVTSITGYRWAARRNLELPGPVAVDYLPLDTAVNARRMLRLVKPAAVVFVKFDLWPNLIWEANRAGTPLFLVSATLSSTSRRFSSALGRSLYATLYACFTAIHAVSDGDVERFLATCPGHPAVTNVGDTRFDSILARKRHIKPVALPAYVEQRPAFIFGSSWPADEAHVFPALRKALAAYPDLVALLVPHEVDEPHLAAIEAAFSDHAPVRLSEVEADARAQGAAEHRIILVDSVGKLSGLYHYADIAFVGGSFGVGVHNVAEPLVMGVPVIFGPVHHNSPEALEFLERGFCFAVEGEQDLEPLLLDFLKDLGRCHDIGIAAREAIEAKGGASQESFNLIRNALE